MADSVFETISQAYYDLTAAEKKTVDFVMKHHDETQYMSIAELADASGVAEATVSRFCRRLGYKGYNAFKLAIANAAALGKQEVDQLSGQILEDDSLEDMSRKLYSADVAALAETLECLDTERVSAAADCLEKAGKVLCMGQGGSMVMASETAHLFSTVSGKFFPISDSHMQVIAAANMEEGDALLFFSYSGATREMSETLNVARARGAKVILVTRFPRSPGAALADVVLCCGSNEGPLQLSTVPAKIAQMFLMDILFSAFCRRNLERCRANRARVAEALAEKHL